MAYFSDNRARGCLFGVAFGDALGFYTEFFDVHQIRERWPPAGPTDLTGDPALVTDDTQMTLAVGEALIEGWRQNLLTPNGLEPLLRRKFVRWLRSPDNNRAAGGTCIAACERLEGGIPWLNATVVDSKGCGANMRVAPVGFLADDLRGPVAQFQAALTHGHPTALAAADATAFAVAHLAAAQPVDELLPALRRHIAASRHRYHHEWLGPLWERAGASSPTSFISSGWAECGQVLGRLEETLDGFPPDRDPCDATGEGWIAEEAFGTALLCFLLHRDDPQATVCRAAVTRGDSDSIGAIAGAFAGACHGLTAWPEAWCNRIEYRDRLGILGRALATEGAG